ncbi:hypothetical protein AJ79_03525 [Helicocarpus griseus UAMH5409]|uniref:Uncharacterized protein n=1 Tax=Helicocarpus griseus UAMH5409 TaxID=1447875 RepID=A0A2B7XWT9_9EURO|nr:hypothetical protein AJ79_03525 [Helicocarpus griseus UAMH5409]
MKYFQVKRVAKVEAPGHFLYWGLDITYPRITTCEPVLSNVVKLDGPISCAEGQGCKVTKTMTLSDTYTNSVGWKVNGSAGADIGVDMGFRVEVSGTSEKNYQETWARAEKATTTYEFTLNGNTECTPSMVHVDLLCNVEESKYKFDARIETDTQTYNNLLLENIVNEDDRPQRCVALELSPELMDDDAPNGIKWAPLWADNYDRGFLFLGSIEALNDFLLFGSREIRPGEIVIRPNQGPLNKSHTRIYVCPPDTTPRKTELLGVPLKQRDNKLLGKVACV